MIELFIASVIIINSYNIQVAGVGGAGKILQEDGTFLLQQDAASKLNKEFTGTGHLQQQDGTNLLQQNGTDKIEQE